MTAELLRLGVRALAGAPLDGAAGSLAAQAGGIAARLTRSSVPDRTFRPCSYRTATTFVASEHSPEHLRGSGGIATGTLGWRVPRLRAISRYTYATRAPDSALQAGGHGSSPVPPMSGMACKSGSSTEHKSPISRADSSHRQSVGSRGVCGPRPPKQPLLSAAEIRPRSEQATQRPAPSSGRH
jgi:hypothetical protein